MTLILYNVFIFFYKVAIHLASPFDNKASLFLQGRKDWENRLKTALNGNKSPVVWFHCASLGEFEQGRPVMEAFKKEFPEYKVFLTFFSPSGYEVRKNYNGADYIFYLPFDTKSNAISFVDIVKPSMVFFVKYEFWHHFTKAVHKKNIPLLSISTIFRPGQIFFKWYGKFNVKILKRFSHFFLQDLRSKELLDNLKINNCEVSGDTRFDRVWSICSQPKELPEIQRFKNNHQTMIVGSAWPEDIAVLTSFINESNLKFIIAPHEIEDHFMSAMQKDFIKKTIKFSELPTVNPEDYQVLIIDNIGMLSSLYKYGEFAFVGGAYGKGLHNILEPATFGIPIFFGDKNYEKFKEAIDLIKLGGAMSIASYDELRLQFRSFSETKTYEIASQINQDYVKNNTGATKRIMNYSKEILAQ
ncbi:3-deoxy-D-manno-octulosonic acid transferase [Fulvivirga sp. RKSG066]|uniref:3-deoxy-D-manno-octulosonic acid transferase n=1 Tax=Fulvivirga aurantia TaxID=2529383 RepID=UPI0012BBB5FB|nr:glycosyltransferase N-terminal domain-containing protein [Fulvivirga aurantia]MTI22275.1 3-deoxy-D-manno-octulosonic acid transferase [Fulvivirga aurantia]